MHCKNCGCELVIVLHGAGLCPSASGDRSCAFEARCDQCSPQPPEPPRYIPPPEPPTDYW